MPLLDWGEDRVLVQGTTHCLDQCPEDVTPLAGQLEGFEAFDRVGSLDHEIHFFQHLVACFDNLLDGSVRTLLLARFDELIIRTNTEVESTFL